MAIYRKGEGLWARGVIAATLFGIALFGCQRLAENLPKAFGWARSVLIPSAGLTGAWAASGVVLAGCAAGLWVLLNHVRAVDFLVDMESELRKVSWPMDLSQPRFADRYRELWQSSMIVIFSVLVMGVTLYGYDKVLSLLIASLLHQQG